MDVSPFLFHGEDPFSPSKRDILHKGEAIDKTREHVWVKEPVTSGVLTKDGVENIANHKYKPGTYTHLDNFLNPAWTSLTELVPMWMAPNMLTTLGGLHNLAGYVVTWYYSKNFNVLVPSWVCAFNGYCCFVCYTLDCMDGKQARRTGTSSPLGQLFDHGFDCLCNIAHLSSFGAFGMPGGTFALITAQSALQFSFFMAQWEEYYTEILPHSAGDWIGVTEVAYGMAVLNFVNALLDREAVWASKIYIPSFLADYVPDSIASLETREFGAMVWAMMVLGLVFFSAKRVIAHVKEPKIYLSAFSKLFSPFLLAIVPFFLPLEVVQESSRYLSLSMGLVFSVITIKMIVFSMAKMAFASFQSEVLVFLVICLLAIFDERLTPLGAKLLFQISSIWYGYRLFFWTSTAISQLCLRLDINCFTIKKKTTKID